MCFAVVKHLPKHPLKHQFEGTERDPEGIGERNHQWSVSSGAWWNLSEPHRQKSDMFFFFANQRTLRVVQVFSSIFTQVELGLLASYFSDGTWELKRPLQRPTGNEKPNYFARVSRRVTGGGWRRRREGCGCNMAPCLLQRHICKMFHAC